MESPPPESTTFAGCPPWVVLSKVPRVSADQTKDLSVSEISQPPSLSYLTVSARIFPGRGHPQAQASSPRVLAADLSMGLFLLATNPDTFQVLYVFSSKAYGVRIPGPDVLDRASLGVICDPNTGLNTKFEVVGFQYQFQQPGSPSQEQAWLHFYSGDSERGDRQYTKAVSNPLPGYHWDFSDVIAHGGRLWWVDTAAGLLSCDPFTDSPVMDFVGLPDHAVVAGEDDGDDSAGASDRRRGFCSQCSHIPPAARCRVQAVGRKLRWVQMLCGHMKRSRGGAPTVLMLTLGDDPRADGDSQAERRWDFADDQHLLSFADIWASDSYKRTGLPEKEPVLAFVYMHPRNTFLFHFVLDRQLFAVRMLNKEVVVEWQPNQILPEPDDISAASSLFGWTWWTFD